MNSIPDMALLSVPATVPFWEQALLMAILLAGALLPASPRNDDLLPRIYAVASTVALILLWYRNFLFTPRIGIGDWQKDSFYLNYLESSLKEFSEIPLSFLRFPPDLLRYPIPGATASYWANPEVITFSPLLILLLFMESVTFYKVSFVLYLSIGAYGCYRLGRRLQLPAVGGTLLFVTIILNPWLLQHIAMGYTPWMSFCLLPLLTELLADRRLGSGKLAAAAALNGLLVYGGALHLFVWYNGAAVIFLLVYSLRKRDWQILARFYLYLLLSGLLILPKAIAALSVLHELRRQPQGSYGSVADLWGLFTDKTSPLYDVPTSYSIHGVALYDGSVYTGSWFVILLGVCVILAGWRWRKHRPEPLPLLETIITATLFLILGFNGIWPMLAKAVPLLDSEVYPWRFLFVTLFLACTLVTCVVFSTCRSLLSRETRALLLSVVLLLPVAVSFQERNAYFTRIATINTDRFASLSILEVLESQSERPTSDSSPNHMRYLPDSTGEVRVDWLAPNRLAEYRFDNVESAVSNGWSVTLRPSDARRPVLIRPYDFGRRLLLWACLPVFFVVLWLIGRYRPPVRRGKDTHKPAR